MFLASIEAFCFSEFHSFSLQHSSRCLDKNYFRGSRTQYHIGVRFAPITPIFVEERKWAHTLSSSLSALRICITSSSQVQPEFWSSCPRRRDSFQVFFFFIHCILLDSFLIFYIFSSITFTCAICDLETSCFPEQRLFLLQPNLLCELAPCFKKISLGCNLNYNAKLCTMFGIF